MKLRKLALEFGFEWRCLSRFNEIHMNRSHSSSPAFIWQIVFRIIHLSWAVVSPNLLPILTQMSASLHCLKLWIYALCRMAMKFSLGLRGTPNCGSSWMHIVIANRWRWTLLLSCLMGGGFVVSRRLMRYYCSNICQWYNWLTGHAHIILANQSITRLKKLCAKFSIHQPFDCFSPLHNHNTTSSMLLLQWSLICLKSHERRSITISPASGWGFLTCIVWVFDW